MAPTTGEVALCNRALRHIGERRISSLSANDNTSQACNEAYDDIRQQVIRNYVWNFAKKSAMAPRIASSTATISGITKASPGVVTTASSHGLATGDVIYIDGVQGMTEVNAAYFTITVLSATTFSIGVNTSAYTTYTGGGTLSLPSADFTDAYQLPSDCLRFLNIEGDREIYQKRNYDIRGRVVFYDGEGANSIKLRYLADITDLSKWDPLAKQYFILLLAQELAYALAKQDKMVARINELMKEALAEAVAVDALERPPLRVEESPLLQSRQINSNLVDSGMYMDFT